MQDKTHAIIVEEIERYGKQSSSYFPSFAPSQREVIELIDLYWVDRYRDGDTGKTGKKSFYNVVVNPTLVSSKMIDFDTKDFLVKAMDGASFYPAWIMQRDLNIWMKEKEFGVLLNQVVSYLPKYGSVLLQKAGGRIHLVPLQNIVWDNTAKTLEDTPIIQKHFYTEDTIVRMGWDESKVQEAISKSPKGEAIVCYSRFGKMKGSDKNFHVVSREGVKLYETNYASVYDLYRKLDWDTVPGRLLGRGQVEKLFEAQIHINRVANYKTDGLKWSSLHIFQTRDQTFRKNLGGSDIENGDVLPVLSEVQPVLVEERNLAAYREEESRWDKLISELTFAYPELSGERPPAGTPLGTTQIQTMFNASFFDARREDIGLFFKSITLDWILPEFKNARYTEHRIQLGALDAKDLDVLRTLVENQTTNAAVFKYVDRTNTIPDEQGMELIKQVAKTAAKRKSELLIPEGFYNQDFIKYSIDVVLTNEQLDVAAKRASIQFALTLLASDPTLLSDKNKRSLFYELLGLSGISPAEFEEPEEQPAIGSMPRMSPLGAAVINNATTV